MTKAELEKQVLSLGEQVLALKFIIAQVDRQSRCRHVWEPDLKDPAKRVCAECGCSPLKG